LDPQRLADALSRVLPDYAAFAGRCAYRAGLVSFVPSEQGVPLEVVESAQTIDELVATANATIGVSAAPRLAIGKVLSGKCPLFGAKLTQAADGCVLGFTWHHAVGDYGSVLGLMSAWAQAYRGLPHQPGVDAEDRDAYLSERLTDAPGATSALRVISAGDLLRFVAALTRRYERVLVHFSNDELTALQSALTRERRVTIDDAMWAQTLTVIRDLRGPDVTEEIMLTVNLRKRLGLPANLIGNVVGFVRQAAQPGDDAAEVAARLRKGVSDFAAVAVKHHATMRFVAEHSSSWQRRRYLQVGMEPYRGNFLFASSLSNFSYDNVTFEAGAPVRRFFGRPADFCLWNCLAHEEPGLPAGETSRVLSMWLPSKLARYLQTEEGRARLVTPVQSKRAPRAASTAPQPDAG
jgi:hypothetical protein